MEMRKSFVTEPGESDNSKQRSKAGRHLLKVKVEFYGH